MKLRWATVLSFFAVVSSCSLIDPLINPFINPMQGLISNQSLVVVQINKPKDFLFNLEQFLKPFPWTKGKSLQDSLKEFQKASDFPVEAIDLDKPMAISVVKGTGGSIGTLVYLPILDASKNFERVKKAASGWGESGVVLSGNYAIVMDRLEKVPSFPLSSGAFDGSKLSNPYPNGISSYVNFDALKSAYLKNGESLVQLADTLLNTEAGTLPSNVFKPYQSLVHEVVQSIDEIRGINLSLTLDANGINFFTRSDVKDPGKTKELIKSWSVSSGSKEFYKYMSTKSLASGAFNLPAEKVTETSLGISRLFLTAMEIPPKQVESYLKTQRSVLELMGNRSAYNADFDFDLEKIQKALSNGVDSQALTDAVDLNVYGVFELKDGEAFHQAQKSWYASNALQGLIGNLLARYKIPVRVEFVYEDIFSERGFPVSALSLKITAVKQSGSEWFEDSKTVGIINTSLDSFLKNLKVYYHFEPTRGYFSWGKRGIAPLKELARLDSAPQPWNQSLSYRQNENVYSDSVGVVSRFSIGRASALFEKLKPSGSVAAQNGDEGSGLVGYWNLRNDGNFESGFTVGLKDLVQISNNAGALNQFIP